MRLGRSKTYLIFLCAILIVISLQLLNVYNVSHNYRKHPDPQPNRADVIDVFSTNMIPMPTTEQLMTTRGYNFSGISSDISMTCRGNIFLYVIVISNKYNFKQRQKIRQSWASIKFINQKLISSVFLVTFDQNSIIGHQSLIEESRKYQDIFYSNYTITDIQLLHLYLDSLRVATACTSAQYHLIIKDDMLPNIPLIINEISPNISLMCQVHYKNKVVRNTKSIYYVSKSDYSRDEYPPHCKNGSPFIMSHELAREIVENFNDSKIWFYDAYLMGILPRNYNVTPVEFPKSISILEMRPHFVYMNRKLYGILTNGILLPGRIWKKLMLQMVLK